jgi:hypothetical protein
LIGALDDLSFDVGQDFCEYLLEMRSLVAGVGEGFLQERIHSEQGCKQQNRPPLASRTQNIHDPVHHFGHVDVAPVAAPLGGRNQLLDMRPFIVGQITGVSQFAVVVASAVLRRSTSVILLESGHLS